MREEGHREPEFIEGPNWFKVILSLEKEPAKESTLTGNVTYPPDGTGLKARILELIKRKKEVSSSDLSQELNVSKATVTSQLNILRSEGRVKRIGAGPMTRYQLGGASF